MNKIYSFLNILVSEDISLREALVSLDKNGLQILILHDKDKKVTGLLTDGDIRRHIINAGPMDIGVKDVSDKNFIKSRDSSDATLTDMLDKGDINHIPVLNKNGSLKFLFTKNKEKMQTQVPVVIVAGGKGTRLSPLTKIIPKPLMPVGDHTMVEKIMANFYSHGLSDFKIIVNYKKDLIKSYLTEIDLPYNIEFIEEDSPGDTAGGLALLKGKVQGPFIVTNCDVIADLSYQTLLDWHTKKGAEMTILGVQKKMEIPYGVVEMDSEYSVNKIKEKPSYNSLIISGIYVINPSVLELIPESKVLGMDKLMEKIINQNKLLSCFPIESGWNDIGHFEEYKKLLAI